MAKFWRQDLTGLGQAPTTQVAPLNGLQLMKRGPVELLIRAQDQVSAMSRRIVASGGMRGSLTWFTPNTDPTLFAGTHPDPDARRIIGMGSVDLTPGTFLEAWATVSPSGQTQLTGTTTPGGPTGAMEVAVDWTDQEGLTVSTLHLVPLPPSVAEFGAEPTRMFDQLNRVKLPNIQPPGLNQTDTIRRWSRSPTVRVEIRAVGGARIVDAVVFETPREVAFEADDAGSFWTSHLFADNHPAAPHQPLMWPLQRFSETTPDGDPRGGTFHISDVHHAQHQRLGPVLFSWSGAVESTGAESVEVTSASFVELAGGGSTAFDITEPGMAVGTGGYARRISSNSEFVLRDRVAWIPVFVRVFATKAAGADGFVRVMSRADSYIDVAVPAAAFQWLISYGWLEVGINPDDTANVMGQVFAVSTVGVAMEVGAVTVHYAGGYAPAA